MSPIPNHPYGPALCLPFARSQPLHPSRIRLNKRPSPGTITGTKFSGTKPIPANLENKAVAEIVATATDLAAMDSPEQLVFNPVTLIYRSVAGFAGAIFSETNLAGMVKTGFRSVMGP